MALSTSTIQPGSQPLVEKSNDNTLAASLLAMLVLSIYGAKKSKKAFRKMKLRFMWTAFKLKMKSMFKKASATDRQLLYILLAVLLLVLLFILLDPIAALIVLLILLILYLLGVIKF